MTYEIQVAHLAISDAAEAFFWLNERAATAAFQWFEGLIKAINAKAFFLTKKLDISITENIEFYLP